MRGVWAESVSDEGAVSDTGTIGDISEEVQPEEDMTEVPEVDVDVYYALRKRPRGAVRGGAHPSIRRNKSRWSRRCSWRS